MAGTTNFVQTNPTAANQQSDGTYDSFSLTVDGIGVDAILPSPWLNKVWFQSSTFIAAMAAAIASFGSGYTITDTDISALKTQFTDFFNAVIGSGVSSLNSIIGAVTLVAGSGIALAVNSPSAGDI